MKQILEIRKSGNLEWIMLSLKIINTMLEAGKDEKRISNLKIILTKTSE
jgi:hypothetical protein